MANGASYSNGTTTNPAAQYVKFTREQNRRLHEARRFRGQSVQTFGHIAMMRAIVEAEAEMEAAATKRGAKPAAGRDAREAPRGLGIREKLADRRTAEAAPDDSAAPAPAPSVSVVVQAAPAAAGDIAALARMIAESAPADRKRALESACRSLAKGRSAADALAAAEELDAAVKRLDAAPSSALERARARRKAK